MNDRDERLIAGLAEVKAEIVALSAKQDLTNGSIAKHFADDLNWQREHDQREGARDLALVEEAARRAVDVAEAQGFRKGLMFPIAVTVTLAGFGGGALGPIVLKLVGG